MVSVTDHGCKRIRSRCGASKKAAGKIAEDAFKNGITHAETTGSLNRYITSLYFHNKTANNIRVFNDKVFIFSNEVLITVLNLPKRYHKIVKKIENRRQPESGAFAL